MNNFTKIFLTAILTIIILSTSSFAGYFYNASYENLTLEENGWCVNLETKYIVYNSSDWKDKESIESNLCEKGCKEDCDGKEGCVECESGCKTFSTISAKVKIYDGPFANPDKLLLNKEKLDENNTFTYTFTKTDQYLLEIFPTGEYNDFHKVLVPYVCPGSLTAEELKESLKPKIYNKTFTYLNSEVVLELKNTNANTSLMFNVKTTNPTNKPANAYKTFEVNSDTATYTKLNAKINVQNTDNYETKAYKLNNNQWIEIPIKEETKTKIILESIDLGTYSISQKEIVEETPATQQETVSETQNNNQNTQESDVTTVTQTNSNKKTSTTTDSSSSTESSLLSSNIIIDIMLFIIGLIVIIGAIVLFMKMKNKTPAKSEQKVEVLTTYNATYQKTKEYVRKYKEKYLKDQIYRALKEAKIPKDIIDRVFNEEYQ